MLTKAVLPSIAFWVVLAMVLRVSVVPPESCGPTDAASLDAAARASAAWIMRNQHADGSYTYIYLIDANTVPDEYNIVRHAGVTLSLYEAAGYYKDPLMLDTADAGMRWMIERLDQRHGWSTPTLDGDSADLGAAGLMTVGLAERRLITGDTQYDDLMRSLGRFIVALQHPDGGFDLGWDLGADQAIAGDSKYYPGESLWALALLHEAFPGEGWDNASYKALDYLVTKRDEVQDVPFPPLPDQWLAYGFAEMSTWDLTDSQIDKASALAGRFGLLVRTEAQRQGSWYGRLTHGREARAAGLGTWVEGLGSLWRLAETDPRLADSASDIRDRLVCSAGLLAARQADEDVASESPQPGLVEGAWFARGETRMDDQQHALSGLLYTLRAMQGNPQRVTDTPVFSTP
jgi:hypothetical protein